MQSFKVEYLVNAIAWVVFAIIVFQMLFYLVQVVIASYALRNYPRGNRKLLIDQNHWNMAPPISIIVPAHNEEKTICESIYSILSVNYPVFDIIVVNDGSTDFTLKTLKEEFELEPVENIEDKLEESLEHQPIKGIYVSRKDQRVSVIDKQNGGKADAHNAGISYSKYPLFCAIDADTILDVYALLKATEPFVYDPARTIAVGGTIQVVNGAIVNKGKLIQAQLPNKSLPMFQILEYVRSFLMGRLAWSYINTVMIISGAFGVFRRHLVVEVGGYTKGSMAEDFDLIVKLHRYMMDNKQEYNIKFVPDAVCWTEAPETISVLGRQRVRWQMGALEVISRYRFMILQPRYGRVGILGISYLVFVDIILPLSEVIGYLLFPVFWFMGLLTVSYFLTFICITFSYGTFLSMLSIVIGEVIIKQFSGFRNLFLLFMAAVLENFGYRQLCSLWRLKGIWRFFCGKQEWGRMDRKGFNNKPSNVKTK